MVFNTKKVLYLSSYTYYNTGDMMQINFWYLTILGNTFFWLFYTELTIADNEREGGNVGDDKLGKAEQTRYDKFGPVAAAAVPFH